MHRGKQVGRICIGTAQFGMNYGVANRQGQVPLTDVSAILARARREGIDTVDTAAAYGDSEEVLGRVGVADWQIVSKVASYSASDIDAGPWVLGSIGRSLARMNVSRIYAVLLHQSADLVGPHGAAIYDALVEARRRGWCSKIGVSIYAPDDLVALIPKFKIDIVQAPFNVVDRRIAASGWLDRLQGAGIEVHLRSIFLQGLLLMNKGDRPAAFSRWQWLWDSWDNWVQQQGISPLCACVNFAMARHEATRIVVGLESLQQLAQIITASDSTCEPVPASLSSDDQDLVNPSRWQK
jgi:aryl-alcohol dehydrogenase-like predicted oxidoreductase